MHPLIIQSEIIKSYETRLAHWISEPDRGQADALVKGFKKANGKYLAWICSDDVLEPSMVSISVHFLERNPDAVLSYGNRSRIDAKGNILGCTRSNINPYLFKYGLGLPQETVLFRKDVYEKTGGINPELQMVMDYDLWCKLFRMGGFFYIPALLGRFRSHENNKSSSFTNEMQHNNFHGDFTAEFKKIYKLHFNRNFSMGLRNKAKYLNYLYRYSFSVSKRNKKIKRKITEFQSL